MKLQFLGQTALTEKEDFTGFGNARISPELSDGLILEHIQKIQRTGISANTIPIGR
jgi:type III restriction enzyme